MSEQGKKYDQGKPQLDLLPYESLSEIAKVLEFGASKYGKNNWKNFKPEEYPRLISAALRHIYQMNNGQWTDDETKLAHAAHAACNMLFLIYLKQKHDSAKISN